MKTLNITFTCAEFANLEAAKDQTGQNWHDFILASCVPKESKEAKE